MNFGEALAALKRGERVARQGWNGKGMWLVLVVPHASRDEGPARASALVSLRVGPENLKDPKPIAMWEWLGAKEPQLYTLLPFIGMKTANNEFVPWLASQSDLLAEDWVSEIA